MCDEMNVIYEDGVENGLEVVVERLAEERDRITGELQKARNDVAECKELTVITFFLYRLDSIRSHILGIEI